jgi:diguanylate cyclase (GGDEF)-like protein
LQISPAPGPGDSSAAPEGPEPHPPSLGRILVVDDVEDNRALLVRRFRARNYEAVEADSGAMALDLVFSAPFDAVLLDIMMPGIDGLETLRRIRAEERLRSVPVIMVTAKTERRDIVEALEAGADDFISKPVDFAVAFARVKGHVERKRAADALEFANRALVRSNEELKEEIANRKRSEARTEYLAQHDALTGLGNQTLLKARVSQAIDDAARNDRRITLAFVDLDNFKIINDSLGPAVGDEFLKILAARMVDFARAGDTVVRLGRDEFVVLIDQAGPAENIPHVVQKLKDCIAEPARINGRELAVTSSIGVATYPDDGADVDALLTNAEAAAQRAKDRGRDNFQFYRPEFNTKAYERLMLLEALRNALLRSEFSLLYQPQVDLRSGRTFGMEALIRWRHPTLGWLGPGDFIPIAEQTGLIGAIGEWVMREACRQNKLWQDAGLAPAIVCVNVSARQFGEPGLTRCVADALAESGLSARFLELELTESLIMQDLGQAVATMNDLRRLGVQLSIDDFGTGYSSLAALTVFPLSRLKVDKSFVDNVAENENDRAVVKAIISLGKNLNLRVIAEGVETAEQVAFLRDNGCDEIQGYYVAKPMAPGEVEAWLASRPLAGAGQSSALGEKSPDQRAAVHA